MQQPYIAIVQVWKSDTETIPIPILGVFPDKKAAEDNAIAVVLHSLTEQAPELLASTVSVTSFPLSDEATREFLTTLHNTRPDLLRTPRGKAKP
jgi:hypothetical protein